MSCYREMRSGYHLLMGVSVVKLLALPIKYSRPPMDAGAFRKGGGEEVSMDLDEKPVATFDP